MIYGDFSIVLTDRYNNLEFNIDLGSIAQKRSNSEQNNVKTQFKWHLFLRSTKYQDLNADSFNFMLDSLASHAKRHLSGRSEFIH